GGLYQDLFMMRKPGTDLRKPIWITCADYYGVDAGEHCAVHRINQRHLDFFQKIDKNAACMPLLCEPHFGKRGGYQEFDQFLIEQKAYRFCRITSVDHKLRCSAFGPKMLHGESLV